MTRAKPLIIAAFLSLFPATSHAQNVLGDEEIEGTEYIDRSIEEIAAASDLIVAGTITRTMTVERENELADRSYNGEERIEIVLATLEIDGVLLGGARKGQRVRLVYPASPRVPGEPVYDVEQQGIWFLRRSSKRGEYLADHPNRLQPLNNLDKIRRIVSRMKTESGNSTGSSNRKQKKSRGTRSNTRKRK